MQSAADTNIQFLKPMLTLYSTTSIQQSFNSGMPASGTAVVLAWLEVTQCCTRTYNGG